MANNLYTTKTAALKATKADINKLETKKIKVNGKDVATSVKHPNDTREVITENDLWGSWAEITKDGEIIFHDDYIYNTIKSNTDNMYIEEWQNQNWNREITKVEDNKGFINDTLYGNIQCEKIKDGSRLFYNCNELVSFTSDLSSLTNGNSMFSYSEKLAEFSSDLSSLTDGNSMFMICSNLTTFSSDLSSLTNGSNMFKCCTNLASFSSDLPSLTDSGDMFYYCDNLTIFSSDLSSLTNGYYMFYGCDNLTIFSSDLSSLTNGYCMFYGCDNLKSFNCTNFSKVDHAMYTFYGCTNLTSFSSDLSSLVNGYEMFSGCKLDAPSVANIIHFIPQRDAKPTSNEWYDGNITIGIGITNTDAAKQAFAEACYCSDWNELNQEFDDKNWVVEWQFNGDASTFDLRSPRPSTAVYAKLEDVIMPTDEKEHKPHYQYTSQDGSKFYNIHWYHDSNTNNEGYDYFESLEEAISAYGVIHK